jgi:hypothetical protein
MKPKLFNEVINLANAQESKEESKKQAVLSLAERSVSIIKQLYSWEAKFLRQTVTLANSSSHLVVKTHTLSVYDRS